MNCGEAEELAQARLDGELTVEQALRLGEHFAGCAACKTLASEMDHVCAAAATLPRHPSEGSLAQAVMARAASEPAQPRVTRARLYLWSAAAGVAAAIAVIALLTSILPPEEPQTAQSRITETVLETPPEEPAVPVKAKTERFDAYAVVQDLYEKPEEEPPPTEAELKKQRRRVELLQDLRVKDKAGAAARELTGMLKNSRREPVWNVAAAVSDPVGGAELFKAVAELKPEMRLVPIYISALDSAKTKQRATELLRTLSGKRFGSQKEPWLAWWAAAREQTQNPAERGT